MKTPGFTDDQRRRVFAALEDDNSPSLLERLQSPAELHQFMLHYNWDSGIESVQHVVTSPLCDRGTALLAYWLSGPIVCEYGCRSDCPSYFLEDFECIADLEHRLLSDSYSFKSIRVDPANLLEPGDDWTLRRADNPFSRDPPQLLLHPTPGVPMPADDLEYELTDEEIRLQEAEFDRDCIAALEEAARTNPELEENLLAYRRWMERRNRP